jgi:hypothetical protein
MFPKSPAPARKITGSLDFLVHPGLSEAVTKVANGFVERFFCGVQGASRAFGWRLCQQNESCI